MCTKIPPQPDTSDPAVDEIFVYAAMLSLLVSRDQLGLVTEIADGEIVSPLERWGNLPVARPSDSLETR